MIHSRLLSIVPRLAALACALGACLAAHADERLPDSTVVASRGGATVTLRDVDASLQRVPASQRGDMMNSPKRIEDLLNQTVGKLLDQFGISHDLYHRWAGG